MTQLLTELGNAEARAHLLHPESYCTLDLPPYIGFDRLLDATARQVAAHALPLPCKQARARDDINHTIISNKDGQYAWRPITLAHPAIYVDLVHRLTDGAHWNALQQRFANFREDPRIRCESIPVARAKEDEKVRAKQILHWWQEVELRSLELSIQYEHLIHTDLTDCYGSVYTHSIAWAMHGRDIAKAKRNDLELIGNVIDARMQDSRHGQTNGIPQGSILMDFVAEMVLGYVDLELSKKLGREKEDFVVLRYRDDYRIFSHSAPTGERILKALSDVTQSMGLRLNPTKTVASSNVVTGSLKPDKLAWITRRQHDRNVQKRLLILHQYAIQYPNSGALHHELLAFCERISYLTQPSDSSYMPQLAIVLDIAMRNPRCFPICAAIMSHYIGLHATEAKRSETLDKIATRLRRLPNTGFHQLWLQRIALPHGKALEFDEPVCHIVAGAKATLWNCDWIEQKDLRDAILTESIVDAQKRDNVGKTIATSEVRLFDVFEGYGS